MQLPKLSTNASVVTVFAIGAACIVYMAATPAATDDAFIPIVVTMAGGIITLLMKQQSTDAKIEKNTEVSQQNADAIADNTLTTESTHRLVNGQSHAAAAAAEENALLRVERAEHKAEMAALAELTRTTLAELAARSAGIVEGRAQITAETEPPI